MRAALVLTALLCAACAAPPPPAPPPEAAATLPVTRAFGPPSPLPPQRSNTEIAQDFLDLSFQLESGQALPVFTRFEAPVTVATRGPSSPALEQELDRLLARMRTEAGLDIARSANPARASIVVEGITAQQLQREVPEAACFVLPARVTWDEFRANPRNGSFSWSAQRQRRAATVFLPVDTSRQDIRDCLHEEVAQALGPLNDLFRLEDSVFNDDNLNSVLTGFDMLILRATYHPSLASGMDRSTVAARLPGVLAALNPRGNGIATRNLRPEPPEWTRDMNRALGPGSAASRRSAARRALATAQAQGWNDSRTALSYFTLGRADVARDGEAALESLIAAGDIYKRREATQIHAAHVGFQIAAFALNSAQWDVVIAIAERYEPVARRAENAALLSDLMLARAAALRSTGQPADAVRAEALAWGRLARPDTDALLRRASEIDQLAARGGA